MTKFSKPQAKISNNWYKEVFLCTFWKTLSKNCVFSARCHHSNNYILVSTILGLFTKNGYLELPLRRDTSLVDRGWNPWRGGAFLQNDLCLKKLELVAQKPSILQTLRYQTSF